MSSSSESVGKTLIVAFLVCLCCAIVVSAAAVVLAPAQDANRLKDRQMNILAAAGLYDPSESLESQFAAVETRVVDLNAGTYTDQFDPQTFDSLAAADDLTLSSSMAELGLRDLPKIGRRENFATVYIVNDDSGVPSKIILPIRGYGLWSTLYGFIALEADASTVAGIGFYEHGETPGLGGEVDNPVWKANWQGKEVYASGELAIEVIKGSVNPESPNASHEVDGLAGATLTTKGVDYLVEFWLGEYGYQTFLENLKSGGA